MRHLHGVETGVQSHALQGISRLVAQASGRPVAAGKSIVGAAVFTHESGIHVDGLLKDPLNYQGFDPAELGRSHTTVLGKHSGSHAVQAACEHLGLRPTGGQAQQMLELIRAHVLSTKRPPNADELRRFYLQALPASACSALLSA